MITTQTRTIDLDDLSAVRIAVDKANRKATKIGVPGFVLVEGARGHRDVLGPDPLNPPDGRRVIGQVETVDVEVLGEAPRYAGWTFVATLTWDNESPVIRKIDGLDIDTNPARPFLKPLWCDHCNAARDRNETYLLHSDSGDWKQVGSTCLREFLGVEVNLHLIGFNPYEGCDSTNRYAPSRFSIVGLLEDTLSIVREYGWLSSSVAYHQGGIATKERILDAYEDNGTRGPGAEYRAAIAKHHREDDKALATEIARWVREVLPGTNDYATNLKAAFGEADVRTATEDGQTYTWDASTCRRDNVGLVVSAVTGYQRWTEKEQAKRSERVSLSGSTYQGEVGQRIKGLALEVRSARWIEGPFGSTLIALFSDASGNAYKWFASNPCEALETVGTKVVLDGTVKKHEEYNGLKSTVLTRCTVKEVVTV